MYGKCKMYVKLHIAKIYDKIEREGGWKRI